MRIVKNNIKVLRVIRGVTQAELADALDVHIQTVRNMENANTKISYEQIAQLMDYFNLKSFDQLFRFEEVDEREGQKAA